MKCPNCGSIVEDSKTKCFMCGTDLTQSDSSNNQELNSFSNTNDFASGMDYSDDYKKKKEEYDNRFNDYRNVDLSTTTDKKDIFDFYNEHKKIIKIVLLVILLILISLIIYKVYKYKTKPVEQKPILNELYYTVDDDFIKTNESKTSMVYNKSGDKGSDCSISISYGTTTSGDHVQDYYDESKKALEPKTDREGNILDQSQVFVAQNNQQVINDNIWYYMSVYYRSNVESNQYDKLRYRYYTSIYKGYYYDIEVANHSNSSSCNVSLDNFINSLKYIDLK